MTSGGKGLHVVAPLIPDASWDAAKAFCKSIPDGLAKAKERHYVATLSKAKGRGRVFVDYLRNGRGATSVAPYTVRARPGAPVATPLRWSKIGRLDRADAYTVDNLDARLKRLKTDPWAGYHAARQRLTRDAVANATG